MGVLLKDDDKPDTLLGLIGTVLFIVFGTLLIFALLTRIKNFGLEHAFDPSYGTSDKVAEQAGN